MPAHAVWMSFPRFLLLVFIVVPTLYLGGFLCSLAGYNVFRPRHQTPPSLYRQDDGLKTQNALRSDGLTLRYVFHHGAGQRGPRARRLDITSERVAAQADAAAQLGPFPIKTAPIRIDKSPLQHPGLQTPMSPLWVPEHVLGPDIADKQTIINFANMSEDAYKPDRNDPEWLDVGETWNSSIPFGWEDSGIRGHVFSDDTNATVILAVKGTTVAMFEGNGTSGHDKENDNLFGSCCCGQGGSYLWRQVCDCQTGTYTCDQQCISKELVKPNRYFEATLELYDEVIQLYPRASIITTGHSLGGVLASLIGLRQGIPAVTFEAYPQALAAARLGLQVAGQDSPLRRNTGAFHFGHTADPVYMGTCNGASSFCSIAGYAFETACHTGKRCVYDVVKDWGWRQSTNTHRLRYAIDNVYAKYDEAAPCEDEAVDCVDCYLWKFENGTHTTATSTTTTATSTPRTRTETCKTPGWWGCRDETTTSAPTTTTSATTTSTTTSTCKTPGWFGCKDKTTSDSTTTSEATTTTCTSHGWFGRCLDPTPTVTTTSAKAAHAYWQTAPIATQTPP
ncbi:autophagy related lipase-like protein Atg15 [Lentithecium fluviatile CBS 122367]|uniref:triacylglycerol lipase n=1 Tax=Lentithecium fluviatile CBS 122367 TaxID=1168545 RepID=A0A6G1JM18_9PLEO|nr:autophagy related lipase-like protein Atg15 [Lentithecium fluviatile CBS 122367]